MQTQVLSKYRCSTCTRVDCPSWIGESRELAQAGKIIRTHIVVAISESLGLACHSDIKGSKILLPVDRIAWEPALVKVSAFAARAHEGQLRKDNKTPYIVHPARVAAKVAFFNGSYRAQCVAWLHDVVEDCSKEAIVQMMELLQDLHPDHTKQIPMITMVWALSKPSEGNREFKEKAMIEQLLGGDQEVVLVKLCDRLDNLYDFPHRCDGKTKADNSFKKLYLQESKNLLLGLEARAKQKTNSHAAWAELSLLVEKLSRDKA